MAVGSRDRPPMLATGRYAQWRSWFLRYIDTRPNSDALRKCILEGDKDMQKNSALIAKYLKKIYKPTNNNLRTSSNFRNKNVDTTSRYKNDNQSAQFRNQRTMTVVGAKENVQRMQKAKKGKDSTYHKEKMLLCKQAKQGVPLQAEHADLLEDTEEESDEQELKAHYSYMEKIQEVPTADSDTDSEPLE
nr:hypothetical protein [Tanacetum cinerariifolium]